MEGNKLKFKCRQCGACCRNLDFYKENVFPKICTIFGYGNIDFPLKNINGVCEHLKENKCEIYAQRPFFCNTDIVFEMLQRKLGLTFERLLELQDYSCSLNRGEIERY
jgi:Fe-S-cluster containining protein